MGYPAHHTHLKVKRLFKSKKVKKERGYLQISIQQIASYFVYSSRKVRRNRKVCEARERKDAVSSHRLIVSISPLQED
jgi:hypothetical protein